MDIKSFLVEELTQSQVFQDKFTCVDERDKEINVGENEEEKRQYVFSYMKSNNIPITQTNYELCFKQLMESQNKNGTIHIKEKEYRNQLNDCSEEELKNILQIAIFEKLKILERKIDKLENAKYEYTVESIQDNSGRTNTLRMREVINNYSRDGWRVVSICSNELGHNNFSVGIGVASGGSNYTQDEIVIVFERRI